MLGRLQFAQHAIVKHTRVLVCVWLWTGFCSSQQLALCGMTETRKSALVAGLCWCAWFVSALYGIQRSHSTVPARPRVQATAVLHSAGACTAVADLGVLCGLAG